MQRDLPESTSTINEFLLLTWHTLPLPANPESGPDETLQVTESVLGGEEERWCLFPIIQNDSVKGLADEENRDMKDGTILTGR